MDFSQSSIEKWTKSHKEMEEPARVRVTGVCLLLSDELSISGALCTAVATYLHEKRPRVFDEVEVRAWEHKEALVKNLNEKFFTHDVETRLAIVYACVAHVAKDEYEDLPLTVVRAAVMMYHEDKEDFEDLLGGFRDIIGGHAIGALEGERLELEMGTPEFGELASGGLAFELQSVAGKATLYLRSLES